MNFLSLKLQISKEKATYVDELVSPITPDFIPKDPPVSNCKPKLCKRRRRNSKDLCVNLPWGLQGTNPSTSFVFQKPSSESLYVHLSDLVSTEALHTTLNLPWKVSSKSSFLVSFAQKFFIYHTSSL